MPTSASQIRGNTHIQSVEIETGIKLRAQ